MAKVKFTVQLNVIYRVTSSCKTFSFMTRVVSADSSNLIGKTSAPYNRENGSMTSGRGQVSENIICTRLFIFVPPGGVMLIWSKQEPEILTIVFGVE